MIELFRYQSDDGREPFTEWLNALRDRVAQARIRVRLRQVQAGNLGDVQPVGAGYRVYYGQHGKTVVILLCGVDKSSQTADIQCAQALWSEWNGGNHDPSERRYFPPRA